MPSIDRRTFLAGSTAAAMATSAHAFAPSANETVVVTLMGANNRGSQLAERIASIPGIDIAYVCDPDERAIAKGIAAATVRDGRRPTGRKDFRATLDDPAVDALVCAAPNHWHAAATLIACDAGKHVYVEKPCSHSAAEGEMMIAAAEKNQRVVQVGMQRRSGSLYQHAVEQVRNGALGETLYAKSWYYRDRPSIGHGKETPPPDWLDYDLWQGPVTPRPYRDNILHYNWHNFWHWGDGELGNNGVHSIDICRWALGVDFPSRVTASGARVRYDDDQETPDTTLAIFECDGKFITWEALSWSPPYKPDSSFGIEIRGSQGTMILKDSGYTIYDYNRQVVDKYQAGRGDDEHLQNFADAIRSGAAPHASVTDGHKSALFCHLGNISYRLGESLDIDAATGRIKSNPAAEEYWSLQYREGWLPPA